MTRLAVRVLSCLIVLLGAAGGALSAQTSARSVLDKTARTLKSSGGLEARFSASQQNGRSAASQTSGTLYVSGNRFKISSSQAEIWFDGKTMWSMYAGSGEVNVSTPTKAELQSINPYAFLDLYRKGYNLSVSNVTEGGQKAYKVRMKAQQNGAAIPEMEVTVNRQTNLPMKVRLKQRGGWTSITVSSLKTRRKYAADFFRFDKSKHKGVEVIDLR